MSERRKTRNFQWHNKLSFVIVVKGGEGLNIAINAKGQIVENVVGIDVKGVHE